jgi:twinkle protein
MALRQSEAIVFGYQESGRFHCPECTADRKKKLRSLKVTKNLDHTLYDCHHCGWHGRFNHPDPLGDYIKTKRKTEKVTPLPTQINRDQNIIKGFFRARGIDIDDMSTIPVRLTNGPKYFQQLGKETEAIGFLYGGNEYEADAIKWRPADGRKAFTQDNSAKVFYGLEALPDDPKEIVIVEGEADVVALASVGITAISVPNGAPIKVSGSRAAPEEDTKFAYVYEARDILAGADRIILAVDQDGPGDALTEELALRLVRAKCWRPVYPDGCNDPTDVIRDHGAAVMRDILDKSAPLPLQGLMSAKMYSDDVADLYEGGEPDVESTGINCVDELFKIKEGMVYVVTGYPCSGKSEFVDQLMVNLSLNSGWKWALSSFENPPPDHIVKLSEKIIGRPFYEGVTPRMTKSEMTEAIEFIDDHFVFLENKTGLATIGNIMDRTMQAVTRLSVRGLIIDPYNYIDMRGPDNEHQSITRMLSELSAFARANGIAVIFVAHPAKTQANKDGDMPVPNGHHISGSAAWWAKADIGFTVHRHDIGVGIHCWKARFKWLGQTGDTLIGYDIPTGRYFEKSADVIEEEATTGQPEDTGNKFTKPLATRSWQDVNGWDDDDEDDWG